LIADGREKLWTYTHGLWISRFGPDLRGNADAMKLKAGKLAMEIARVPKAWGGQTMRKTEAQRVVLREWDVWASDAVPGNRAATSSDGFAFYWYLRADRPHMLNFRNAGWDVVHSWLREQRKVH
jgi:hypothetical protein